MTDFSELKAMIEGATDLSSEEREVLEGLKWDAKTGVISSESLSSITGGMDQALSAAAAGCGGGGCCPWGGATY